MKILIILFTSKLVGLKYYHAEMMSLLGLDSREFAGILIVGVLISCSSAGFLSTADGTENSDTVSIISQSAQCIDPPSGLEGWWSGDGSTNNLISNNPASVSGTVTFGTGKVAQAFSFNGSGYLGAGSLGISNDNQPFSIIAWIKPTAAAVKNGATSEIADEGSSVNGFGNGQYFNRFTLIGSHGVGSLYFEVGVTQTYSAAIQTSPIIHAGKWNLVTVTYDGSRTPSGLKIYVNGTQQSTTLSGSGFTGVGSPRDEWAIGSQIGGFYRFSGLIDETEIFNTAVTPQVIQSEFTADSAGKCKQSLLVGSWPANGNANDITGNGHNGVLSGGVTYGPGKTGKAFSFDGANGSIDVGSLGIDTDTKAFSVVAWINPSISTINDGLVHEIVTQGATPNGFGNGQYFNRFTLIDSNGPSSLYFEVGATQTYSIAKQTSPVIQAGKWNFVTVTYDGTRTPSGMKIYVNATEQPTTLAGLGFIGTAIPRDQWSFGAQSSGTTHFYFYNGTIDNVKIYSCALNKMEVRQAFHGVNIAQC